MTSSLHIALSFLVCLSVCFQLEEIFHELSVLFTLKMGTSEFHLQLSERKPDKAHGACKVHCFLQLKRLLFFF